MTGLVPLLVTLPLLGAAVALVGTPSRDLRRTCAPDAPSPPVDAADASGRTSPPSESYDSEEAAEKMVLFECASPCE